MLRLIDKSQRHAQALLICPFARDCAQKRTGATPAAAEARVAAPTRRAAQVIDQLAQFTGIDKCLLAVPEMQQSALHSLELSSSAASSFAHTHTHTHALPCVLLSRALDTELEGQQIIVGTVGKLLDLLERRGSKPKLAVPHLKIIVRGVVVA